MRGRTPILREYTLKNARHDLANGVHFGVVSLRLGVSEEDLALVLDLSAEQVVDAYGLERRP